MTETRVDLNSRKRQERAKRMQDPEAYDWFRNTHAYRTAHESPEARESRLERCRTRSRDTIKRDRETVFAHYGNTCDCCGESELAFLTVDHVNGGGNTHRKTLEAPNMYTWLVRNDYPNGYRILCFNCNCVATRVEVCPHNG